MARQKSTELMVRSTLYLPVALHAIVKKFAAENDTNVSALVTKLLRTHLVDSHLADSGSVFWNTEKDNN